MKRCPRCNCGAEFTNKGKYYGGNAFAFAVGLGVGAVASIFSPNHGSHAGHIAYHNVSEDIKKHYKCTNSGCGYEWDD